MDTLPKIICNLLCAFSAIMFAIALTITSTNALAFPSSTETQKTAPCPCKKTCQCRKPCQCQKEELKYFYSDACEHCQLANNFLVANNNFSDNFVIKKMEIYNNSDSRRELFLTLKQFKIDSKALPLPVLCTKFRCFAGEESIIKFFKLQNKKKPNIKI